MSCKGHNEIHRHIRFANEFDLICRSDIVVLVVLKCCFVSCSINVYWLSLLVAIHLPRGFWMKKEGSWYISPCKYTVTLTGLAPQWTATYSLWTEISAICVERFSGEFRMSEFMSGFIPARDHTTAIFVATNLNNKATLGHTLGFIQERSHSYVQNVGDALKTRVWRTSMWNGVKFTLWKWWKLRTPARRFCTRFLYCIYSNIIVCWCCRRGATFHDMYCKAMSCLCHK